MLEKLKEKLKSKSFWLCLIAAVIFFAQMLGLKINAPYAAEIINALLASGIFVGIVAPQRIQQKDETEEEEEE